jgi:hypothetical protein
MRVQSLRAGGQVGGKQNKKAKGKGQKAKGKNQGALREPLFHARRAVGIENGLVRVTVLSGGGHIAEICLLERGVNPLWIPPWASIEPDAFDPRRHRAYGNDIESRLLAGIMGHNLCFDFFGAPSEEEAKAGLGVHGEAPVVKWKMGRDGALELVARAVLPLSQIWFERRLRLAPESTVVLITETVENLTSIDRAVGWTEHVTLGPPFLAPGRTVFDMPATRSKVFEGDFGAGKGRFQIGAEFDWPMCPAIDGGSIDLRQTADVPASAGYTAHLMDLQREQAWFTAFNPDLRVLFGYVWRRSDFPWLGIWEENHAREHPPWNGKTLTRGMEFGVSPMPETRWQMIDRGSMFGVPGYRWIPARARVTVEYCAFIQAAEAPAAEVEWRGDEVRVVL